MAAATAGFSTSEIIGSGVSGDVYRGIIDGVPVAAKMDVLSTRSHGRLIHVIGYAQNDDAASLYPMAIALEFMEAGSLADRLRGPIGEAPKRTEGGPLTLLDRVDIALGVASGLSYLHGQAETTCETGAPGMSSTSRKSSSASCIFSTSANSSSHSPISSVSVLSASSVMGACCSNSNVSSSHFSSSSAVSTSTSTCASTSSSSSTTVISPTR